MRLHSSRPLIPVNRPPALPTREEMKIESTDAANLPTRQLRAAEANSPYLIQNTLLAMLSGCLTCNTGEVLYFSRNVTGPYPFGRPPTPLIYIFKTLQVIFLAIQRHSESNPIQPGISIFHGVVR